MSSGIQAKRAVGILAGTCRNLCGRRGLRGFCPDANLAGQDEVHLSAHNQEVVMTRPLKKEHEKRLATRFLDGWLLGAGLVEGERPDFRVRRHEGDIALEVTEYHAQAPEGGTCRPRIAVEVPWWRYVEPTVNSERQARCLKYVHVHLRFADHHLPGKTQGPAVARELVGAVAAAVADRRFTGKEAMVEFAPRAQIASFGDFEDGTVFLPQEDWPNVARRLESLIVRRHPLEWPSWDCQNASTAWVGPDVNEFKRIFEDKAEAAKGYMLDSMPLWLLIVCDAVDDGGESHGDLSSHIFPRNDAEGDQLDDLLRQTGFDFRGGPFAEVWLFSNFTKERRRLHPLHG
jgi:hypothetical protein